MNYLADTTVLVAHLRKSKEATKFLEEKTPTISTITVAEIIQGAINKKELKIVLNLLGKFHEETISLKISKKAIELLIAFSASHGLKFMDAVIAATAASTQSVLVSDNIKHFKYIPGLKVLSHSEAFKKS